MIDTFIVELFIIFCARNMGETLEEAIIVMTVHHLSDPHHIILTPMGVLKMAEKGKLSTFWWLFTWLDQGRVVHREPCHQICI